MSASSTAHEHWDDEMIEQEEHPFQDEGFEDGPADPEVAPPAPSFEEGDDEAPVLAPRPEDVPAKFWDEDQGLLRTDALIKSYRELERKLGQMIPLPEDGGDPRQDERMRRVLGIPEGADDYRIHPPHELLPADPDVNRRLHKAGFSENQAQLVYDLAAEHVVPLICETIEESAVQRDTERLAGHFGGAETWRNTASQLKAWGEAHLAPDVMNVLASSVEGVLAMHQMMQSQEPEVLGAAGEGRASPSADDLAAMMRDTRYWRDRDPRFIQQVTEGFKRLYAG